MKPDVIVWKHGRRRGVVKRTCEHCARNFYARTDVLGKFCSGTCQRRANAAAMVPMCAEERTLRRRTYAERLAGRFPERMRAYRRYDWALQSGKLVRGPCEVCGATEDVHGHHDDYSKPLDVRWLCRKHHRQTHGGSH